MALDDGPSILLDKPVLLLGRHPECDVQIESRKISRKHCVLAQVNDYLVIRDLGSTNGIRINGVRVAEGRLASGDELTVGNCRYRLIWDTIPESARSGRNRPKAAAPADDLEDELLESCEVPIPLGEPGQPVRDLPLQPLEALPAPLLPVAQAKHSRGLPAALPPDRPAKDEALLLPDHLDLVPLSDAVPDSPDKPPSGSARRSNPFEAPPVSPPDQER
jgi:predicted component of type VI protein secretion system